MRKQWAVVTTKISTGARAVFSLYTDRAEADRVVEQLGNVGCPAWTEPSQPGDIAGLQQKARA